MSGPFGPPNQKQLSLVAGANVTLSLSASGGSQTITIIGGGTGATGTGANFSAGTQSAGSGTIIFSNSNSISFGMAGSQTITASIAFPAFASQQFGASNLGNLSGTSGMASGSAAQMVFVGGNNVTLSQSLNGASGTLTISAFTQTVQTQNRFNATLSGNTSGVLAAISSGTVTLVGGNNITLSQVGNSIVISAPTPGGLQTAVSGLSAGTTSITSGTVSFANSNGVSFGIAGQTITASAAGGNQASVGGNTSGTLTLISSGTLTLAGGNNITLSQVGNGITISGPNTAAQTVQTQSNIQAIIPLGNTTGTSGTIQTGSIGLAGGANITISQSSGANSTNLTIIGAAGVPFIGLSGNTSGTSSSGPGTIYLIGDNNVTLSARTGVGVMSIAMSVPNTASQSVQTQNLIDLQIGTGPSGGTTGTTALISSGTMTLAAGSNVTLSQAGGNGITILAGQSIQTQSLGALSIASAVGGSTTGTVALMTGTITIAAGNRITLSQAGGNAITISASNPVVHVMRGNTTGTTASISTGTMTLAGGARIILSQVGNAVTASVSDATFVQWTPVGGAFTASTTVGQSTLFFFPANQPGYLTASRVNAYINMLVSTSSNSSHAGTLSYAVGVYTLTGSTLSSATTGSTSLTWNITSSSSSDVVSGFRQFSIPMNVAMTPGDYWIAMLSQTSTSGQPVANWVSFSNAHFNGLKVIGSYGVSNTVNLLPGQGRYSAATAAFPASVQLSQILGGANIDANPLAFNFVNITN